MDKRDPGFLNARVPNFARVMNYLDGGKDNFAVDRVMGDELLRIAPEVPTVVAESRKFVSRAVTFLAEAGVRQFVDVGCGLPTHGSVHEILHDLGVNARVVYVDEDPVVVAHGKAIVATRGEAVTDDCPVTRVVQADPHDPDAMLDHPELTSVIDLRRPTAILLRALLAVFDDDTAARVAERLVARLSPGGYLLLGHAFRDPFEEKADEMSRHFNQGPLMEGDRRHVRSLAHVARFLDGLDVVPPGLTPLPAWRPRFGEPSVDPETFWVAGAVGRKP
ncbi:SAM-dependent methyltransferase [Actinomadura rugatobispora]|uniref:SAM-dependent methyltransferase n=1 Tax=Actinomadura rugatobispora TaxID=1994 RepID=A0ABW1A9T3_9ACTN|nr:SAM-dependent methyltransferase [Actinomadura rugatobispora]